MKSKTKAWEPGEVEWFIVYKILYPFFNGIGLNRQFNLFRHRLGRYTEFADGRCQWCGEYHRGKFNQMFN